MLRSLSRSFRVGESCHHFHSTSLNSSQNAPQQGMLPNLILRRKRRDENLKARGEWLSSEEGKSFRINDLKAIQDMRGRRKFPFPMNPYFKPEPPISNTTRDEIFKWFKENPQLYTPKKLAEEFGLSIQRITAILRMKSIEQEWNRKRIPIQTELSSNMDILLGAVTIPKGTLAPREKLRPVLTQSVKPLFEMVDEEVPFTPEDAAVLIQKEPYANIQARLDRAAEQAFSMDPPQAGNHQKILQKDPHQTSVKARFMITDCSRGQKYNPIVVREKDGTLRQANRPEIWWKKNAAPQFKIDK